MSVLFDHVEYSFHPVGQGLFTSSAVIVSGGTGPKLQWVFDCGTASEQTLLTRHLPNVSGMNWKSARSPRIDLVAISHFDKDHVSGLAALIGRYPIDTLLLPFAPLASRLVLAFEQGVLANEPAFAWFADPVGYVRSLDGGEQVTRIIFVGPSAGDGPAPPGEAERPPPAGGGEGDFQLRIDAVKLHEAAASDLLLDEGEALASAVGMLEPGGRIWVDAGWEFVPYNNAELAPPDLTEFRSEVEKIRLDLQRAALLWRTGQDVEADVLAAIDRLRAFYDERIGSGGKARNLISLFLYSGPTRTLWREPHQHWPHWLWDNGRAVRASQLFSGDGYLDTEERTADLENYLSANRMDRVGVFQVMHHGARGNWHPGLGARLSPAVSLFSSDPDRGPTYHPHAEVLRDFWAFNAIQVDRRKGYDVSFNVRT